MQIDRVREFKLPRKSNHRLHPPTPVDCSYKEKDRRRGDVNTHQIRYLHFNCTIIILGWNTTIFGRFFETKCNGSWFRNARVRESVFIKWSRPPYCGRVLPNESIGCEGQFGGRLTTHICTASWQRDAASERRENRFSVSVALGQEERKWVRRSRRGGRQI